MAEDYRRAAQEAVRDARKAAKSGRYEAAVHYLEEALEWERLADSGVWEA